MTAGNIAPAALLLVDINVFDARYDTTRVMKQAQRETSIPGGGFVRYIISYVYGIIHDMVPGSKNAFKKYW